MLEIISQVLDTIRIDPLALEPNASYQPLCDNHELAIRKRNYPGVLSNSAAARFVLYFRQLILNCPSIRASRPLFEAGSVYFCTTSNNQIAALRPVARELEEVGCSVSLAENVGQATVEQKSLLALAYFVALPFLPILLWRLACSKGYQRYSFKKSLDSYWHTYGLYFLYRRRLDRHKPAAVVVSNDHLRIPCTFVKAAQDKNIPTFYIQHASVTEKFPPLRVDYALLDGRDAMDKYLNAGQTSTRIYLIGSSKKTSGASEVNRSETAKSVGLCLSNADSVKRFISLMDGLAHWCDRLKLIVRPHPTMQADITDPLRIKAASCGMEWSDSKHEPADAFLEKIDVIICGASAITLEAAIRNIVPINFTMNDATPDWYGYVAKGLCPQTSDIDTLNRWINDLTHKRWEVRKLTQYYDHSIDKPYEGRSAKLAADLILKHGVCRYLAAEGYVKLSGMRHKQVYEFDPLGIFSPFVMGESGVV